MTSRNMGRGERQISAVVAALALAAGLRGRNPMFRALAGAVGTGFLLRSIAGHCAIKAAVTGQTSLGQGIRDEWEHLRRTDVGSRPPSRSVAQLSDAVDESVAESFPASDPPSSHLPDLPPSNAEAKWAAAREGQQGPEVGWKA